MTTEVLTTKGKEVKALRLIPGDQSRFEVKVNGEMIYTNNGDIPDAEAALQKLGIRPK